MTRRLLSLTLVAALSATCFAQLTTSTVVSGLSQPVQILPDPTDSTRLFIVQQGGQIRVLKNGVLLGTPYLTVTVQTGGERGLLGMALHPEFASNGHFYVNFSESGTGATRIVRYTRNPDNSDLAVAASNFNIIRIPQDYNNHNGGTIRFGEDSYLYIGMGDGGSGFDPLGRSQQINSLLGKYLRIDVNNDGFPDDPNRNYAIPGDNPFISGVPVAALGEIWSFGIRNPWKWSFDSLASGGTGAMVIADVGQGDWEEVNYEPLGRGGRNYGWVPFEGFEATGLGSMAYQPHTPPIFVYGRDVGGSITGGFVYRGMNLGPAFYGRYFYADYVSGRVRSNALSINPETGEATASAASQHFGPGSLGNISSIDIDHNNELLVVSYSGIIRRLLNPSANSIPIIINVHLDFPQPQLFNITIVDEREVTALHTFQVFADEDGMMRIPVPNTGCDVLISGNGTLQRRISVPQGTSPDAEFRTMAIKGDLDGDGYVSFLDLAILWIKLNSQSAPVERPWRDAADINGDGVIDLQDFQLLVRNLGRVGQP
ncbi:MAG: PQQ-dependent sugar dehydrogenase [Fimbriimonadaceae bacterium]